MTHLELDELFQNNDSRIEQAKNVVVYSVCRIQR